MNLSPAFRESLEPVLLSLADDELVIGHRHSEWTGWAPHIEEDIAFSSIAQDEIGHATLLYHLLSEVVERTPDEIALGREHGGYRHARICERPNGDWAYTLARHFIYDVAERIRLTSIKSSAYRVLAEAAEKLLREERYHELHADAWIRRLSTGPVEGRHELSLALSRAIPDAVGLFEPTESESEALETGVISEPSETLLQRWLDEVIGRLDQAGIAYSLEPEDDDAEFVPTSTGEMIEHPHGGAPRPPSITRNDGRWTLSGDFPGMGGRRGSHSPDFDGLWDDLTKTYREEPTATW
ncbi:MAG: 1,2-phenylacetyl-CoA epoxidase subunit PaaC [Actinomycetota bacterium]